MPYVTVAPFCPDTLQFMLPMAQHHGDTLADWEEPVSFSLAPTPHDFHMNDQGGIPLEAQRRLEETSTGGLFSTADGTSLYANDIKVSPGRLSGQQAASPRIDGSYRHSEHSDPTNTACLPPDHTYPAQSDLQLISSWIIDKNESSTDPGFYSNPSADFDSLPHQHYDSSYYSASPFSVPIATESVFDVFSEQVQTQAFPAVGWDLRSVRPHLRFDTTYDLTVQDQSAYESIQKDEHSISDYSTTVSLADQLRPCTVSSELIGSDRLRSKQTSTKSQGDFVECEKCGAKFTGRYARGNCSRHVRLLHSEKLAQPSSDLVCRVCHKGFKRQDARRKHEWRKHEIGETRPIPRRQPASSGEHAHAYTHQMGSDHETATCTTALPDDPGVELQYYLPSKASRAYDHFADARLKLSENEYNRYCHMVLLWCGRIVEGLLFERSELHATFARQLCLLEAELRLDQQKSSDFTQLADDNPKDAQCSDYGDDGVDDDDRQNKGKFPISRRASKASSRSHPYSGRPSKKTPDSLVDILEQFEMPREQDLDCPIHKWHLMHRRPSPCHGCGKTYMNGVRQHLLPTYSQQHRSQLPFIQRCENCKDDFVDARTWGLGGHCDRKQQGAGTCRARTQPQGSSLVVWARLFLKIFPEETQVPSPYRNDPRRLPASLVALLRNDLGFTQVISRVDHLAPPTPSDTLQGPDTQMDNETEAQDLRQRFEQMETELAQNATIDTLVSRASEVLAQFLAQEFTEINHERVDIDAIKVYYINRLNQFRHNAWTQLTQAHQTDSQTEQALLVRTDFNQAHVPAFGGAADFSGLSYRPDQALDMPQIPDADVGTQSSSQGYHTGDASFGYPSSSTSYDPGLRLDSQVQQVDTQFCTPADLSDFSSTSHDHRLYLSPHDVYLLDQPGPSRLPQQLATNSLLSEVDSMMISPSEMNDFLSYSSVDPDDDVVFPNIN